MSKVVFTGMSVRIEGLESLLAWLGEANPKMQRALKRELKEAVSGPVLRRARANAGKIADDGTYKGSLSVGSRKNGAEYVLKSDDAAAGVKEFAHKGARYRVRANDKRVNLRKMGTFPVGVPKRAGQPRVMIPAVNDSAEEVESRVGACLDKVLGEAGKNG